MPVTAFTYRAHVYAWGELQACCTAAACICVSAHLSNRHVPTKQMLAASSIGDALTGLGSNKHYLMSKFAVFMIAIQCRQCLSLVKLSQYGPLDTVELKLAWNGVLRGQSNTPCVQRLLKFVCMTAYRTRHRQKDGTYPLRFIDLDWAGPAGEATYPPFMNHTHIKWPEGVRTNAPILAEHDVSMAKRSYELLVFEQKQLRLQKGRGSAIRPLKPAGKLGQPSNCAQQMVTRDPAPARCCPLRPQQIHRDHTRRCCARQTSCGWGRLHSPMI